MFQLAQVKEGGDGEELTNVLVIITQNGVTPLNLNTNSGQQIVVVNQGDKATPSVVLNQNEKALTLSKAKVEPQFETDDKNPVVFKYGDSPVYQDHEQTEQDIENEIPVVNFVSTQDDSVETATIEIASIEPDPAPQVLTIGQLGLDKPVDDVPEILYRCDLSRNILSLQKHLLKHEGVEKLLKPKDESNVVRLRCRFCTKTYRDPFRLQKHEKQHENSRLYNCNICKQTYFRIDTFEKHCKIHEKDGLKAMAVQNETLKEDAEEYVGTMIKIEVDDTEEDYEDENNVSNDIVPETTVEVTPENTLTDSSKDFEKQSVLEVGMMDSEGENEKDQNTTEEDEGAATQKNTLYCCSHCGKMLPWNADLVKHMETHLPDKPGERPTDVTKTGIVQTTNDGRYLCSICGRHFTNLIALQSHIKNIHNMDISDYELNYKESEGVVMTAEEIKEIEKQIQENLRFKESGDIKNYLSINHLETHRLIKHDTQGGEPITPTVHECDEPGCKKYFNKRFNLLRHQLIHRKKTTDGESQDESMEDDDMLMVYECRKCYEAFMSLDELELHVNENHSDDTEQNGSHDDSAEDSKLIEDEANMSTGDAVQNEEEVVPVEIDISTLETVSSEALLDGNNQSEGEVNVPSLVEEVPQNFHIGGNSGQEVIELSSGNIPIVMNDSQGQEVIIRIPQDMNSGEENVYQCQIVKSSEDGSSEGVPVYITQHMVTTDPLETTDSTITMTTVSSETSTADSITIDTLPDTTDNDNNAAIAMVALSTDSSQYIEDDHSYI
ncbi:KRAB [Mytilus coruscus]|uniref:KRAB n=1 Tax=Mytilus coruscus TaxID=42192 RepID=A0A6J8DD75_MYTCO|nr:KRAB [Mytilus coruscus]